jgi:hypothetical protein
MASKQEIITELGAIEYYIKNIKEGIEEAFDKIDSDMKTWNLKRYKVLKYKFKQTLESLSQIDSVSFKNNFVWMASLNYFRVM